MTTFPPLSLIPLKSDLRARRKKACPVAWRARRLAPFLPDTSRPERSLPPPSDRDTSLPEPPSCGSLNTSGRRVRQVPLGALLTWDAECITCVSGPLRYQGSMSMLFADQPEVRPADRQTCP